MTGINMVQRSLPELTTPGDDDYSWSEVVRRRTRVGPITWVRLLYRPWLTVLAPASMPCEITTFGADPKPIYLYKRIDGRTYLVRPASSPGFPGS